MQKESNIEIRPGYRKSLARLVHQINIQPLELDQIIILGISPVNDFSIKKLEGSIKLKALLEHTFRISYISEQRQRKAFFDKISLLADQTRVFQVMRTQKTNDYMLLANFVRKEIME